MDPLTTFCHKITKKHVDPVLIPFAPQSWAEKHKCFKNVDRMVRMHDGSGQMGWQFVRKRLDKAEVLVAVHHCCWLSPDDELVDITPAGYDGLLMRGGKILFLPDRHARLLTPGRCRTGIARPSIVFPLTKNDQTEELLDRFRRLERADLMARASMCRVANAALGAISGQKETSSPTHFGL